MDKVQIIDRSNAASSSKTFRDELQNGSPGTFPELVTHMETNEES
jgi:hypothetical protein